MSFEFNYDEISTKFIEFKQGDSSWLNVTWSLVLLYLIWMFINDVINVIKDYYILIPTLILIIISYLLRFKKEKLIAFYSKKTEQWLFTIVLKSLVFIIDLVCRPKSIGKETSPIFIFFRFFTLPIFLPPIGHFVKSLAFLSFTNI